MSIAHQALSDMCHPSCIIHHPPSTGVHSSEILLESINHASNAHPSSICHPTTWNSPPTQHPPGVHPVFAQHPASAQRLPIIYSASTRIHLASTQHPSSIWHPPPSQSHVPPPLMNIVCLSSTIHKLAQMHASTHQIPRPVTSAFRVRSCSACSSHSSKQQ